MFGMQILDVAIGLIFIFLLLSLVVTAANELIASWLKRRSATLWRGVVQLLGEEKMAAEVYRHPLIAGLTDKPWFKEYREKLPFKKRPSYIPSRTFALALLDRLAPVSTRKGTAADDLRSALDARLAADSNDHIAKSLGVLLEDVNGDIEEFKKNIEIWFNNSMERVTGWYKRRTQWILLLLAVLVTVWMNADTIAIANTLWRDPAMRSALVAQAQQFAEQQRKEMETAQLTEPPAGPPAPPDVLPYESAETKTASEKFEQSVASIERLAIPLGWRDGELPRNWSQWCSALDRHFLGWLLTALAISLGSPFWFDMLNKVIGIRSAGKAPEEEPKAPKKVPAPVEPGGEPAKS